MKKILIAALILLTIALTLTACGEKTETSAAPATPAPTTKATSNEPAVKVDDFFTGVTNDPEKYNGKTVTFTGFYFTGFEVVAVCEKLTQNEYYDDQLDPDGIRMWAEWESTAGNIIDQLYTQNNHAKGYPDYYGKMEITGRYEYGGKYGHMDSYKYRITIFDAKVLDWKPGE